MNLYLIRVRRWWIVPLALALLVLACWTVGSSEVPVPNLLGGMAGARLDYFSPLLVIVAGMYCMERRLNEAEVTAVSPIRQYDRSAAVLTVILAHFAGLMVGMDIARNVTLLLALALCARRVANEAVAATVGLMFLIINLILGRAVQPNGHTSQSWWALALYPAGSAAAWLLTIALFALSLMAVQTKQAQ
ncbi:hypothetical protein ABZ456_06510 [Streptomyces sp. NPDC005776]|uniref:hypothetical protein n=1 Tax=Streptomyces sp. NPDC005776 TaxID=3154676 RepID=UPI0033C9D61F